MASFLSGRKHTAGHQERSRKQTRTLKATIQPAEQCPTTSDGVGASTTGRNPDTTNLVKTPLLGRLLVLNTFIPVNQCGAQLWSEAALCLGQ